MILSSLKRVLTHRAAPIADRAAFETFHDRQAAFLAQKTAYHYCRARTGVNAAKMMQEPAFLEAMEVCRWEAYAAVLADLLVLADYELRDAAAERRGALTEALMRVYRRLLESHPLPPHRSDWADRLEIAERLLGQARMTAPHPAHELAPRCGKVLFDHLPIHEMLRQHDEEMIINQLRMGLMHHAEKLQRRLQAESVVDALMQPAA